MPASSEPKIEKPPDNDNEVSISDAETQPGNEHSPSDNEKYNDKVHEDTQPNNDKEPNDDVEIEPAVDLDNPQPKNKRYNKRTLLLENMVKKGNHGFKNPCPFRPDQLERKMMKNLNALLKCLGQSFRVLAWLIF